MNASKKSLDNLKKCHKQTRNELAKVPEATIKEIYGESYSKKLHREMKRYGDGHSLYGIPKTIKELKGADAVVLFAMNSPSLGADSDFNPFTPIPTIHYWRGIESQVRSSKSNAEYQLHFMTWQQRCEIHGKDTAQARKNRKLLIREQPRLDALFQREREASIEFLELYKNWLLDCGNPFILIINCQIQNVNNLDKVVWRFWNDPSTCSFKAEIFGKNREMKNRGIMRLISDNLPED